MMGGGSFSHKPTKTDFFNETKARDIPNAEAPTRSIKKARTLIFIEYAVWKESKSSSRRKERVLRRRAMVFSRLQYDSTVG